MTKFINQELLDAHSTPSPITFQIFGNNLPNTVLFHVQLTCNHSKSHLTIVINHLLYLFNIDLSPTCWRPLAPASHLLSLYDPLWTFWVTQKTCATWCYLHTLAEAFQVLMMEFSPTSSKISGLFILQGSEHNDLKKGRCKQMQ